MVHLGLHPLDRNILPLLVVTMYNHLLNLQVCHQISFVAEVSDAASFHHGCHSHLADVSKRRVQVLFGVIECIGPTFRQCIIKQPPSSLTL